MSFFYDTDSDSEDEILPDVYRPGDRERLKVYVTDCRGRTALHRYCMSGSEISNGAAFWSFLADAVNGETDMHGRTPFHYAAMCGRGLKFKKFVDGSEVINYYWLNLISCLEDKDVFGRTPLHYACTSMSRFSRRKYTDPKTWPEPAVIPDSEAVDITDVDGISPRQLSHLCSQAPERAVSTGNDEHFQVCGWSSPGPPTNIKTTIPVGGQTIPFEEIDAWKIWEGNDKYKTFYADRNEMTPHVNKAVDEFMERLAAAIGREDERLQCDVLPVGSSYEGTKVDLPDEFDFNIRLTKFGEICEVETSPYFPPGFVVLRKRPGITNLFEDYDYECFFNEEGTLNTQMVAFIFQRAMFAVFGRHEFWASEPLLEDVGDIPAGSSHIILSRVYIPILLKFTRAINGKPVLFEVKIDIAPVIHIAGWWPADARSLHELPVDEQTRTQLLSEGCNFVLDTPFHKYGFPMPEREYVMISFARAESILLRQCPPVVRAALMVAKHIRTFADKLHLSIPTSSHTLKTTLLISVFEKSEDIACADISMKHLCQLIEKLFLLLYRFNQQDFLPSFFLPTMYSKVWSFESCAKYSHAVLLDNGLSFRQLFQNGVLVDERDVFMLTMIKDSLMCSYILYTMVCGKDSECVLWTFPELKHDS